MARLYSMDVSCRSPLCEGEPKSTPAGTGTRDHNRQCSAEAGFATGMRCTTMLMRPVGGKKVHWQELLRHELLTALAGPVVIVPVGSIEQHGPHCPQDVDISIPYHLAIQTAAAIDEFPVIVAPPVSLGFTHYNMGEVGTITSRWRLLSTFSVTSPARSGRTASSG